MDQEAIIAFVRANFDGVDVQQPGPGDEPEIARGDTFFIYDPERNLEGSGRFPFATIVIKNYPGDEASQLDREGAFRLNIGAGADTFAELVGDRGDDVDYAALDTIFPHPVYGRMHWLSVINPSEATFETLKPALAEAYEIAVGSHLAAPALVLNLRACRQDDQQGAAIASPGALRVMPTVGC